MQTLTIELPDKQAARLLQTTKAKGVDASALVSGLIDALPVQPTEPIEDRTLEVLAQWQEEDSKMTPEEIAQEEAEWEEFKRNINANRALTGEEPVYL